MVATQEGAMLDQRSGLLLVDLQADGHISNGELR